MPRSLNNPGGGAFWRQRSARLGVVCMAHPKRVAKVQQALKREISTMFVSDKASRPYLIPQHPPASQGTEALGEAVHTGRIPCPHRPFRTSQRRPCPPFAAASARPAANPDLRRVDDNRWFARRCTPARSKARTSHCRCWPA